MRTGGKPTTDRTKTRELFLCVFLYGFLWCPLHGVGTTVSLILPGDPHPGTVYHSSQRVVYIGERDVLPSADAFPYMRCRELLPTNRCERCSIVE